MKQDTATKAEQIKKNVAEGKRLCREIKRELDEYDVVIASLRAVGIEVESKHKGLAEILKRNGSCFREWI
jgi:alkyl hydroperoxide reductase subunit AhpF